jgi:glycosyltransferase involved in cell wall biosynthesis
MVFLFQRFLPHYRIPVYNLLNKKLNGSLLVIHGQPPRAGGFSPGEQSAIQFSRIQLRNLWIRGEAAVIQNVFRPFLQFGKPSAVIIEHNPRILSLFILFIICKLFRIPFILWGHGGSRKRAVDSSHSSKDRIHKFLIRQATAYICYSNSVKTMLSALTNSNKLFVAQNTLDTDLLKSIYLELQEIPRLDLLKKLGLRQIPYLCFIGRLVNEKGIGYLIDIYKLLKKKDTELGLVLVGDGPYRQELLSAIRNGDLHDVYICGEIADLKHSSEYLFVSEMLVIPGGVGLAVNHAFFMGIPVVTQAAGANGPFHGPEAEFISQGSTGFFADNGDKNDMCEKINIILRDSPRFKRNVLDYARKNLSIEQMVQGVVDAITFAKQKGY